MNKLNLKGLWDIIAYQNGKEIGRWHLENQLTDINQTIRDQLLLGTFTSNPLEIKYIAFGTGTTPASATDTALVNEQFRKQITNIENPTTGTVKTTLALTAQDANFNIREIGVFCGDATATAGTGTLLSRINVNIDKNSSMTITLVRTDLCTI